MAVHLALKNLAAALSGVMRAFSDLSELMVDDSRSRAVMRAGYSISEGLHHVVASRLREIEGK